jgi:Protein of unknown function (DUF1822)
MNPPIFDLNPQSIWLEFSSDLEASVWEQAIAVSPEDARPIYALNLLTREVLLAYLQDYWTQAQFAEDSTVFWQLGIEGIQFTTGDLRGVLLPSDTLDCDELRVPQEWVDCPELAADFYLAVQIDRSEKMARIWGYTTYDRLKKQGCYCGRDRTYVLDREQLDSDINSLSLIGENHPADLQRPEIEPLPKLALDGLLQRLETLVPTHLLWLRRTIEFSEWATILSHPHWRNLLLQKRQSLRQLSVSAVTNHLERWLKNHFAEGWLNVQQLIAPQQLGSFMHNQVKRAKLVDLGLDLDGSKIVLMVMVGQSDRGMSIQASLYPTQEATFLPPHLRLVIATSAGQVFKEVAARSDDEFIRYKFDADRGDLFDIQVILGDAMVEERFQV